MSGWTNWPGLHFAMPYTTLYRVATSRIQCSHWQIATGILHDVMCDIFNGNVTVNSSGETEDEVTYSFYEASERDKRWNARLWNTNKCPILGKNLSVRGVKHVVLYDMPRNINT